MNKQDNNKAYTALTICILSLCISLFAFVYAIVSLLNLVSFNNNDQSNTQTLSEIIESDNYVSLSNFESPHSDFPSAELVIYDNKGVYFYSSEKALENFFNQQK